MTPYPTAAAMRAAQYISNSCAKAGLPIDAVPALATIIDIDTHLPALIAFVKEWRDTMSLDFSTPMLSGSMMQFCHEADQLLKDVGE